MTVTCLLCYSDRKDDDVVYDADGRPFCCDEHAVMYRERHPAAPKPEPVKADPLAKARAAKAAKAAAKKSAT